MANTEAVKTCPLKVAAEIALLRSRGIAVTLIEVAGQCYAQVPSVVAPAPPWDRSEYQILIAVPLADRAALDAFYLELPYQYKGGSHQRVNGNIINFNNRSWQLVSWHYPDGRPWVQGKDDLDSHITHCKGFFCNRGAVNAIA